MVDDDEVRRQAIEFSWAVVEAFGIRNSVFHLEAFHVGGRFVFLEIASRPGGAGTQSAIKMAYGVDLLQLSIRMELGKSAGLAPSSLIADSPSLGGYLLIPPPLRVPHVLRGYRINFNDSERAVSESIFASIGTEFLTLPVPYQSPATFTFKSRSTRSIESSIHRVIEGVSVFADPINPVGNRE